MVLRLSLAPYLESNSGIVWAEPGATPTVLPPGCRGSQWTAVSPLDWAEFFCSQGRRYGPSEQFSWCLYAEETMTATCGWGWGYTGSRGQSWGGGQVPLCALWCHGQRKHLAKLELSSLLRPLNSVFSSMSIIFFEGRMHWSVVHIILWSNYICQGQAQTAMQSHWVWSKNKGKKELCHSPVHGPPPR